MSPVTVAFFILGSSFFVWAQPRPVVVTMPGQPAKTTADPTVTPAPPVPQANSPKPRIPAAPAASPDDRLIESKLQAKLAKSKVGADGFTFHVRDGIVTWEGTTSVPQHKGSATRMAKTSGARAVVNRIVVRGNPAPRAAALNPRSEARNR